MLTSLRARSIALTCLSLAAVTVPLRAGEIVEQVLVRVNGEIITKTEFEQRQVAALRQRPDLSTNTTNDAVKRAIEEITPDLILGIVDELLMIQRGRELGYSLGDAQFTSILDNIKKENKLESDEDFQAALRQENMTLADLRRQLERQMLVSRVQQQEVSDKISVTDEEARAYYAAHGKDFTSIPEIALREILIEVAVVDGKTNVAEDEAARDKAEQVRARLVAGEPFARLAAEVSDAPSKANGGLIGPFKRTELALALQQLIDPLDVGGVSQPVRSAKGYQVFKLESRTAEEVKTFDAARGEIADRVAQEKHRTAMRTYIDTLRDQAIIRWGNEELKKAYDQALARRKAATGAAE